MKKSSAKARRQRDDRAYAEFEAAMRKLAKATKHRVDDDRLEADDQNQNPVPVAAPHERG